MWVVLLLQVLLDFLFITALESRQEDKCYVFNIIVAYETMSSLLKLHLTQISEHSFSVHDLQKTGVTLDSYNR